VFFINFFPSFFPQNEILHGAWGCLGNKTMDEIDLEINHKRQDD